METFWAKILALSILLVLTVVFGLIPIKVARMTAVFEAADDPGKLTATSILNCFAGGVFLGTTFLHLFPEVKEGFAINMIRIDGYADYPLAELVVAVGFFLVLILEQSILVCKGTPTHNQCSCRSRRSDTIRSAHSELPVERQSLLGSANHTQQQQQHAGSNDYGATDYKANANHDPWKVDYKSGPVTPSADGVVVPHGRHDHLTESHAEYADVEASKIHGVRSVVLVLALSLHTIFEGLALGLQKNSESVFTLMIALSLHKVIVAFSLGIQLVQSYSKTRTVVITILLFSLMSPIGVAIGTAIMGNTDVASAGTDTASSVLQAIATGTFFYVTFFEILQKELGSAHMLKVLFIIIGFACVAGLNLLEGH